MRTHSKSLLFLAVAVIASILLTLMLQQPASNAAVATTTLYGNVDIRELNLSFRQAGRVASMLVDEGDSVAPGDPIATLEADILNQQVARGEALLAAADAKLSGLMNGSRPEEILRGQAEVRRLEARLTAIQSDLARQRELAQSGASSQKLVEQIQSQQSETEAAISVASQSLALLVAGPRSEDIAAARAQREQAAAELELARIAAADANLVAPGSGIVLSRLQEPGSLVSSRDPVVVLSLTDRVYVRAYVAEPELGRVQPGTTVTLTTDSSTQSYQGTVGFVSPRAEFTPRSVETEAQRTDLVYRLRIVVDSDTSGLLQGMPVTVQVGS